MVSPDTFDTFRFLSDRVDTELKMTLENRSMPLYEMMRHHLGWVDSGNGTLIDRIHGVACLTASENSNGDMNMTLPAAASIELVDNFSQIHEDIQAGNMTRNGRDAVWWVWGPAQAINAGDGMHALARLAMFRLRNKGVSVQTIFQALRFLDDAALAMCEGRFRDLETQESININVEDYLSMAALKKGSLLACACKLGALIAGRGEDVVEAFNSFGTKLGIAIQIEEDIRQVWGSDNDSTTSHNEVLNKKKLLPIVYSIQAAKVREKRRLGEIFMKRVLEPTDITIVRSILDELGARKHSETLAENYRSEAVNDLTALSIIPKNDQSIGKLTSILTNPLRS